MQRARPLSLVLLGFLLFSTFRSRPGPGLHGEALAVSAAVAACAVAVAGLLGPFRMPVAARYVLLALLLSGSGALVLLQPNGPGVFGMLAAVGIAARQMTGRPGIAVLLPTHPNPTVLIDAGATADPKPEMLVQFGQLGTAYAQIAFGVEYPKVGLLTIGTEPGKGNMLTRRAHELLAAEEEEIAVDGEVVDAAEGLHVVGVALQEMAVEEVAAHGHVVRLGLAAFPRELWRHTPIGRTLTTHMWLEPAAERPTDPDQQVEWLYEWWQRLDQWVRSEGEETPGEEPRRPVRSP